MLYFTTYTYAHTKETNNRYLPNLRRSDKLFTTRKHTPPHFVGQPLYTKSRIHADVKNVCFRRKGSAERKPDPRFHIFRPFETKFNQN